MIFNYEAYAAIINDMYISFKASKHWLYRQKNLPELNKLITTYKDNLKILRSQLIKLKQDRDQIYKELIEFVSSKRNEGHDYLVFEAEIDLGQALPMDTIQIGKYVIKLNHPSVKYLNDIDANVYNKNNEIFQQELWLIKTIEQKVIVEAEQKEIVEAQHAAERALFRAKQHAAERAAERAKLEQIVSDNIKRDQRAAQREAQRARR